MLGTLASAICPALRALTSAAPLKQIWGAVRGGPPAALRALTSAAPLKPSARSTAAGFRGTLRALTSAAPLKPKYVGGLGNGSFLSALSRVRLR